MVLTLPYSKPLAISDPRSLTKISLPNPCHPPSGNGPCSSSETFIFLHGFEWGMVLAVQSACLHAYAERLLAADVCDITNGEYYPDHRSKRWLSLEYKGRFRLATVVDHLLVASGLWEVLYEEKLTRICKEDSFPICSYP